MAGYRTLGLTIPIPSLLDPVAWVSRYANGLLVTDGSLSPGDAGKVAKALQKVPAETIRWHLRCALSELEVKLGIPMGIQICKSDPIDPGLVQGRDYDRVVGRLPYVRGDADQWFLIKAPSSLISVERVRAYYFGQLAWEISEARGNMNLLQVEWPKVGELHVLPTNLAMLMVTPTGQYGIFQTLWNARNAIPGFWALDYTTGPIAEDGTPGEIELVLANWVCSIAGISILGGASMAASKGFTSTSLSFDGVSRSISLPPSLFGALSDTLDKTAQRIDWKSLRSFKRPPRLINF
jgi:hypothetical protein